MLQGTRQTTAPKEKLRAGSPPRQPKPTGKAAEKLLARKKMLVLCDLPKRGDPRPVRTRSADRPESGPLRRYAAGPVCR